MDDRRGVLEHEGGVNAILSPTKTGANRSKFQSIVICFEDETNGDMTGTDKMTDKEEGVGDRAFSLAVR